MASRQAVYAPKCTPQSIVQRPLAEILKILKMPDVMVKPNDQLGMEIGGSSANDLASFMTLEIARWAGLVKKSGATAS